MSGVLTVCGYMESKRHWDACSKMYSHEFIPLNRSPGLSVDWSTDSVPDDERVDVNWRQRHHIKATRIRMEQRERNYRSTRRKLNLQRVRAAQDLAERRRQERLKEVLYERRITGAHSEALGEDVQRAVDRQRRRMERRRKAQRKLFDVRVEGIKRAADARAALVKRAADDRAELRAERKAVEDYHRIYQEKRASVRAGRKAQLKIFHQRLEGIKRAAEARADLLAKMKAEEDA